jgi:uroporphyrinogen-III synthase
MTNPLIILRPEPGCAATLACAQALGLEAHGFPLFAIDPRAWAVPDPADFDALLIGSAQVPRHAGPGLAALAALPAYAVGEATARACSATGLTLAATGAGGLQPLLAELAPGHRRLLRLCGAERIALAPPAGVTIAERIVYAARPLAMPPELADLLPGAVVALHSAEAARHFAGECARLGLDRTRITLVALAPRIADAADADADADPDAYWAGVSVADRADDAALLALAAALCETAPMGSKGRG